MRIIAGLLKGRTIKFPKSKLVRPTTDKAKESIFNSLSNYIDFDGIEVCDIYAGSGSLGLEALSRGAAKADFIEKNYHVYKVLAENIKSLNVTEHCKIFKMEAVKFSQMKTHSAYDLILADPPFFKDDIYLVVENLIKNSYLKANGRIIIERSVQTEREDKEAFKLEPFKKIGDSLIYQIINE
jgi:16S rRNA (guanine966-N2)-methyltransferase